MSSVEIFEQNRKLIREAEPGSCIYGILEKIAHHIHQIRPSKTPERDWNRAQIAFACYSLINEQAVSMYIKKKAYEHHEQNSANSPFDNWLMAQDRLARLAAERLKEDEIKIQEERQKKFDSLCWEIEKGIYKHLFRLKRLTKILSFKFSFVSLHE